MASFRRYFHEFECFLGSRVQPKMAGRSNQPHASNTGKENHQNKKEILVLIFLRFFYLFHFFTYFLKKGFQNLFYFQRFFIICFSVCTYWNRMGIQISTGRDWSKLYIFLLQTCVYILPFTNCMLPLINLVPFLFQTYICNCTHKSHAWIMPKLCWPQFFIFSQNSPKRLD